MRVRAVFAAPWAALWLVAAPGCGVELEHGLDERQANQVASLLESAGIGADKLAEDGQGATFKVVVARGESARAFALLSAHDLPRRARVVPAASLLPSAVEERARQAERLAGALEESLEGLPGVVSARVHLALPEEDPLVGEVAHARPTASVLLRTTGAAAFSDAEVRRIVAGAVHSLQAADVAVLMTAAPADGAALALDRLGPVRVAHESRATLAAFATSGLALILLLAVVVVLCALRLGALRRRLRELEKV
jgi:type III secretion protein J